MDRVTFTDRAWDDYLYWQTQDKKTLRRINTLINDIDDVIELVTLCKHYE